MKNLLAVMVAALTIDLGACLTETDDPIEVGADESALCVPVTGEERACGDLIDNDCDGLTDYCDPDCRDDGGCLNCNSPDLQQLHCPLAP